MSPGIEAFVDTVRAFCKWVESDKHDCLSARQFLLALMQGIPQLVLEDTPEADSPDYPRRGHEEWKSDFARLADLPLHRYRMVYSPCEIEDKETLTNDLRDDLADIYGDLWHGLAAWNLGDAAYAVQHWRESYFYHWGHHASASVYAIDEYYRKTRPDE
jgi:hypothetical protein